MLKTFYKFTVVRDPIERLLSAYKDKAYEEFRGQAGEKVNFIFRLTVTVFLILPAIRNLRVLSGLSFNLVTSSC